MSETNQTKLPKLFIPGPVDIAPETYEAMCQDMIGHRGGDFEALYASIQPGLKKISGHQTPCVSLHLLSLGGHGRRYSQPRADARYSICAAEHSLTNGMMWPSAAAKKQTKSKLSGGSPSIPKPCAPSSHEGGFDTVTMVHNETSTGVMNDLAGIAAVVKEFPGVLLVVDTVSSLSAVPVEMDKLGIDVVLAGVQKALALPPGLAVFAISEAALERASQTEGRGYYFDFVEFEKNAVKNNTPSTPAVSLMYALKQKVDSIMAEGLEARFARHAKLNGMIHAWVAKHGFKNFAPEGYQSKTLTAIDNNDGKLDVAGFIKALRAKHNVLINGGYGKIKGITFRISNMGNETEQSIQELIDQLDEVIVDFK